MGFRKSRTAIESAFRISINIQKVKKEWSYLKLINIPNADINGIIYNVVFNVLAYSSFCRMILRSMYPIAQIAG